MITIEDDEAVTSLIKFLKDEQGMLTIDRSVNELPDRLEEVYSVYLNYTKIFSQRLLLSIYNFAYRGSGNHMQAIIYDEGCMLIIRSEDAKQHVLRLLNNPRTHVRNQEVATSLIRYLSSFANSTKEKIYDYH